jgi:hypothetical protein
MKISKHFSDNPNSKKMKKIIYFISASMLTINAFAGNGDPKGHPDKYCSQLKDGKVVVIHEGDMIMASATLTDGTVVKTDGTVLKKDGTTYFLKVGECIDRDGKISEENPEKNKTKANK